MCAWFSAPESVEHYARATVRLGLWRAERVVITRVFEPGMNLLDVGCGAGRIALGLWDLGYRRVTGVDYCAAMVGSAGELAAARGVAIPFVRSDATELPFPPGAFDGAIFGFNGLMQIPGRDRRRQALAEMRRVVRPGGHVIFTTHDRGLEAEQRWWAEEAERWSRGAQDPALVEFGDRILERPEGRIFMHLPDREEILADLTHAGLEWVGDALRSHLANEPAEVREFADECRFWIARVPP